MLQVIFANVFKAAYNNGFKIVENILCFFFNYPCFNFHSFSLASVNCSRFLKAIDFTYADSFEDP